MELESDGGQPVHGPYELTVDGPGRTYGDWVAENFAPEAVADPAISGRAADPDGDGLSNGQEFLAWTDPQARDSVLQLTEAVRVSGGIELRWQSVAGRFYKIAVAERVAGPFLPLAQEILATDEAASMMFPLDSRDRQLYFQVILVGGDSAD